MTFTDATILAALAALAVPLIIHLLGRRRAPVVTLPTVRFADGAHIASRGRRWLKSAGLLAARLAVVALLVLALAGPYLCDNRALTSEAVRAPTVRSGLVAQADETFAPHRAPTVRSGLAASADETLAARGHDPELTLGARTTPLAPARETLRVLIVDAAGPETGRLRSADLVAATFAWGASASTDRAPSVSSGSPATSKDLPPSGATPSLRSGLEPSPSCVTVAQLTREALAAADVVFWVGPQTPPDAAALPAYLARGGAVVWVPAEAPQPPGAPLAAALGVRAAGAQDVADGVTIDPGGYTSDLVAAFEGGTSGDLGAPVFRRRLLFADAAAAIAFRDGRTAIAEGRTDKGRTVALAAGPSPAWGDLAGRAEFVVLMHSLAEALAPQSESHRAPSVSSGLRDPADESLAPHRAPTVRSGLAASAGETLAAQGRDPELTLGARTVEARATATPLAPWLALAFVVVLAAESLLAARSARRANLHI